MSDDKDKKPPEDNEERTVFMPSGGTSPGTGGGNFFETPDEPAAPPEPESRESDLSDPEQPAASEAQPSDLSDPEPPPVEPEPAPPALPEEEARTVFAPAPEPEAGVPAPPPAPPAAEASTPPPPAPTGTSASFTPREHAQAIKVGDCLNHIFEVKRFLARGGMGEVFEGCNVNTDEKVAIKVMLPALAADEKVVALFRKEARTLTKLQHEALVSYRVLAQEPQLGVLYIVTEFIEGVDLAHMLGKVERTPDELAGLLKRLASGLAYAHRLGAVHRDLSPDNVLLPGGDVHQAKIIDFGIAKDLDAGSATIVGDGFAGKLNYVAPEQLGDYGREVGPWTDVYSLGLVMLAVAQGKNVNMSGSLVDAIDKRRKGPDLSAVPDSIRPVLEAMLRPDPKERLRSMDDVIAMLSGAPVAMPPPPPPPEAERPRGGPNKGLIVGGVLAAALAAGAGAWYFMDGFGGGGEVQINGSIENGQTVQTRTGDPVADARNAVNSVLPSVACTWLDIASVEASGDGVVIAMRGVAGNADEAQQEIAQAVSRAGVEDARLDFGDVAPITQSGCAALDTYRQVRADRDYRLSVAQPRFEMAPMTSGEYAGREASTAAINFDFRDSNVDFAILGIEPTGAITPLIVGREDFERRLAASVDGRPIAPAGEGRYRLNIDADHEGWSGIILVTGTGPFPPDLVAPPIGSRGPSWQDDFIRTAAERSWRVEMAWYESVNRDQAALPVQATPAVAGLDGDDKP